MKFTGRVTTVFEKQSGVSAKGTSYTKQEFIVTGLQDQYPDQVLVTAIGDDTVALLNNLVKDAIYDFEIDMRVSQGTSGRMFQNAKLYKVRQMEYAPNPAAAPAQGHDGFLPY